MTPRVLDHAIVQICNKDNFDNAKTEVLKFIKFYDDVTQSGHETRVCQCSLIENTRISLQARGVTTVDRELVCDCGTTFLLLVLVLSNKQPSKLDLEDALVAREFDYLYHSSRSVLSID